MVWAKKNLTYEADISFGDLQTTIPISKDVQNNGSLYLHLYFVKAGLSISSLTDCRDKQTNENCLYNCAFETNLLHRVKRLNLYKRPYGVRFSDELSDSLA
ncbi:hypothetical protein L1887_57613 [Cichorium endivia]|nr:hypothetical protein L1887_57613 [Cichorium endivia]